jgi:hypothetical protein
MKSRGKLAHWLGLLQIEPLCGRERSGSPAGEIPSAARDLQIGKSTIGPIAETCELPISLDLTSRLGSTAQRCLFSGGRMADITISRFEFTQS